MEIKTIEKEFSSVVSLSELEALYDSYCGKQGSISQLNKQLGTLSPEEKKVEGQRIQALRQAVQELYDGRKTGLQDAHYETALQSDPVDYSLSMDQIPVGHMHILHTERRRMEDIFSSMGFMIHYGDDIVTKYENFYAVNIPSTHPATEMHDTLFLQQNDTTGENLILRTHTSAMQNRLLRAHGAPLRLVIPGKVYRNENLDASHDVVFWQLEGLVVDKDMSIAHFKDLMTKVFTAMFGKETTMRMRPAYFPFVEPGFEIDASCPVCDQKGCSLCKQSGRIELLGAGMVHPHVLEEGGLDPKVYRGFAFGLGLNRLVAVKYGIKDIRLFTNGDLKFLQTVG